MSIFYLQFRDISSYSLKKFRLRFYRFLSEKTNIELNSSLASSNSHEKTKISRTDDNRVWLEISLYRQTREIDRSNC
jgi:hypothetical protein